jgi:hypothetical protein
MENIENIEDIESIKDIIIPSSTEKKIIITGTNTKYQIKKINCEKEKKKRVETKTWGLNVNDLSYTTQYDILKTIFNHLTNTTHIIENSKNYTLAVSHIKSKISGYKQQDIIKKLFNEKEFICFEDVVSLLNSSEMKCHYCACEIFLLYELVRETKQWSLDRINNDIGHNRNNLVVACLECNLKRRRTNKDSFMFTKNLKITREGLN